MFSGLTHSKKFATDSELNNALTLFYWNWSLTYDNVEYLTALLQCYIGLNSEYWNERYSTTLYEYDPIKDYGETTTRTVNEDTTDNSETNTSGQSNNQNYEMPYNSSTEKERSKNTTGQSSTGVTDSTGSRKFTESLNKSGTSNIRDMPEFIERQRDTLISIRQEYIDSFKRFFYIDL